MSSPLGLLVCEGQAEGVTGLGLGVDRGAIIEMESKQGGAALGRAGALPEGQLS